MAGVVAQFHKAKRQACKASITLEGLSGMGKTGAALALAYYLSDESWDDVYANDTENKSMNLYVGTRLHTGVLIPEFNVHYLTSAEGYMPSNYEALREAAIKLGGKAMITDSYSHMWQYKGGILNMVAKITEADPKHDKYRAWGDETVVAEKNQIIDLIRHDEIHCIGTIRVKEKMDYELVDGKQVLKSMGEQQLQMPGLKYEPDLALSMEEPGSNDPMKAPKVRVIKTRYQFLKKDEVYDLTKELMLQLKAYLADGADPAELIELQRLEYVTAIKEYLNDHISARNIWKALKENEGHKETKLEDMPLAILKKLYPALVA